VLVTVSGPFNVPAAADKLHIEILDGSAPVTHKDWCYVKINAILYKGAAVVGAGEATADFASGRTAEVTLALTSR
jgi:hypothetical protein